MEVQPSLPPLLNVDAFDSLIPNSLFNTPESDQEYQFLLRYVTKVLTMIDHSDTALLTASNSPIESRFLQPNQEVQAGTHRVQGDIRFISEMTMRCCFSLGTIMGALDYMVRLQNMGAIRMHSTSWKTIFVTCCLLGEKMWEDNYVHPSHIISQFGYLAKGGSKIPKKEYLNLQVLLLGALSWDTNIPLTRFRETVVNIMAVSVPPTVYKAMPMGYAGFVPRPLPPVPKMNLPTMTYRPKAATVASATSSFSSFAHGGSAASTSADSPQVYEDDLPIGKPIRLQAGLASSTATSSSYSSHSIPF